jgi:orotate phosphoribosyltransferase
MEEINKNTAVKLLQIKAIKLQPTNPFIWASGWISPIYCDNRKTLSFPDVRNFIRDSFVKVIKEKYANAEVIAGVATGAIAIGVLVAQELNLPFIYVRSEAKGHGLQNIIEGDYKENQKIVVIEDLISTGGSSLKAVDALRNANCNVLGMIAIFSYGFNNAITNFEKANIELTTLSNYNILIEEALKTNYIKNEEKIALQQWRISPETWGK